VSELQFLDKGNDDFDLVCGPIKIELTRGVDTTTEHPTWRFWALKVNKETVMGSSTGRVLKQSKFTRFLEEQYELSS
jgi:hypothetical protein